MSSTGYFQYNMRTVVHSAWGGIIRVPALLEGLGARRVLLISDIGLKEVGVVDKVAATFGTLHSGNMLVLAGIYTDIEPDAGSESINKCTEYARQVAADTINGLVTHTMKIKRAALEKHYGSLAEKAFSCGASVKEPLVVFEDASLNGQS